MHDNVEVCGFKQLVVPEQTLIPAVLHTASLFLKNSSESQRYVINPTSMLDKWWLQTSRIQKTNRNSLKGLDMEVTVSTDVAEHKKAGIKHNCSQTNKFWFTEFRLQFRSFLPTEKFTSSATKHSGRKLKGCYREFLPIQHILGCYWPGSYALRGVIDHCICFRWGLPFFSWLFSDASFDPDANFGSN